MIIREPAPKVITEFATCHPDRELHLRGLCSSCYHSEWREKHRPKAPPNPQGKGGYAHQYEQQLYALAHLVFTEVHRLDGTPDQSKIDGWLAKMNHITARRKHYEQKRLRREHARLAGVARDDRDRVDALAQPALEAGSFAADACATV